MSGLKVFDVNTLSFNQCSVYGAQIKHQPLHTHEQQRALQQLSRSHEEN